MNLMHGCMALKLKQERVDAYYSKNGFSRVDVPAIVARVSIVSFAEGFYSEVRSTCHSFARASHDMAGQLQPASSSCYCNMTERVATFDQYPVVRMTCESNHLEVIAEPL
jgi:hypothetical protein